MEPNFPASHAPHNVLKPQKPGEERESDLPTAQTFPCHFSLSIVLGQSFHILHRLDRARSEKHPVEPPAGLHAQNSTPVHNTMFMQPGHGFFPFRF